MKFLGSSVYILFRLSEECKYACMSDIENMGENENTVLTYSPTRALLSVGVLIDHFSIRSMPCTVRSTELPTYLSDFSSS